MRRPGILASTVLLAVAVATIAVVVAALVSLPLIRSNAEAVATAELSRFADITATSLRVDREGRYLLPPRVAAVLESEEVTAYVVTPNATDLPSGVGPDDVSAVTRGDSIERRADAEAGPIIIVGRPYEPGIGVILIQPSAVAGGTAADVLVRLVVALMIGLGIAVAIALVAGARLTTPLRRASDAALRLGRGERGVHVALEGPAEIADMADALNRLAAALAVSEGRQREFLLSVSHELRTPMTSVRGYAEALADGLVAPSDVAHTGEVMVAETQRLDRLVSDLLDLARLRADDFTITLVNIDLARVLTDAIEVWSDRCARVDVRIMGEVAPGVLLVRGDPLRLRQVIDNLAENALRLVPAGGVIVMSARLEGEWGVVEVRDSGPGLSGEDLAVAFEPGILHERYRGLRPVGTGLGLALVGRLASGMGGWARADTAPEGGAAFSVGVPSAV